MDKKKRTEEKHDLPTIGKDPAGLNWKVLATVVTVVGGLIGIAEKVNHVIEARRVPLVETRHVLLKSDCLRRFVQDTQGTSETWQITHPAFTPNLLFQEVHRAFDQSVMAGEGETVASATFLIIKNISSSQVSMVLKSGAIEHRAPNVPPNNTVVYCVRVNHKGGKIDEDDPIDTVIVHSVSGSEKTIHPGKVPSESDMLVLDNCSSYGYPPK